MNLYQYFPDPKQYPQAQDYSAPRGYFWRRTNEINHQVIRQLTKAFTFEHFTLHDYRHHPAIRAAVAV